MTDRRDFLTKGLGIGVTVLAAAAGGKAAIASVNNWAKLDDESVEFDKGKFFPHCHTPSSWQIPHPQKRADDNLEYWSGVRSEVQQIVNEKSLARKVLMPDKLHCGDIARYEKNPLYTCHVLGKRGSVPESIQEGVELFVPTFELGYIISDSNISPKELADIFIKQENNELINGIIKYTANDEKKSIVKAVRQLIDNGYTPKLVLMYGEESGHYGKYSEDLADTVDIYTHPYIPAGTSYVCANPKEYAVMPIRQNITILLDSGSNAIAYEEIGMATLDRRAIIKVVA